MPTTTIRPAADPLDDIDRTNPVDKTMDRQDRADLPGQRSDEPDAGSTRGDRYLDATREVAQQDERQVGVLDDHEGSRVPLDAEDEADLGAARANVQPIDLPRGADDDDPIDETERAGDDSLR